jgi:uncharacterized membrane protein
LDSKVIGGGNFYIACLFDSTGHGNNIKLGTLGGQESIAWSISDNGIIVGQAYTEIGQWRACLFDASGQGNNIDLNTVIPQQSGWVLEYARGVNNDGDIVGWGINPDGIRHAYLLTSVPEPTSLLFLSIASLFLRKKQY